ncbi:MAG: amidohydrolase family protein [Oribacterium sp.]|nr:amidohydrolase family protein [Oribacterium sp.]MBP3804536.1 amidohydrolase family protein [Oribacterium sp.]
MYFELSHAQPWSKPILKAAVEILGADHIIYGSSYPVKQSWMLGGPEYIRNSGLAEEDIDLILRKNAVNIYKMQ